MLALPFLECCIGKLNFDAGAVTSSVASPTRPGITSLSSQHSTARIRVYYLGPVREPDKPKA